MSLLDAPYRFNSLQKSLLAIAGLMLFLAAWWLLAEQLSVQAPVGYANSRMPSSLSIDPDSISLSN